MPASLLSAELAVLAVTLQLESARAAVIYIRSGGPGGGNSTSSSHGDDDDDNDSDSDKDDDDDDDPDSDSDTTSNSTSNGSSGQASTDSNNPNTSLANESSSSSLAGGTLPTGMQMPSAVPVISSGDSVDAITAPGISKGGIAGVAIASFVIVGLAIMAFLHCRRRLHKARKQPHGVTLLNNAPSPSSQTTEMSQHTPLVVPNALLSHDGRSHSQSIIYPVTPLVSHNLGRPNNSGTHPNDRNNITVIPMFPPPTYSLHDDTSSVERSLSVTSSAATSIRSPLLRNLPSPASTFSYMSSPDTLSSSSPISSSPASHVVESDSDTPGSPQLTELHSEMRTHQKALEREQEKAEEAQSDSPDPTDPPGESSKAAASEPLPTYEK
ncbi:hypothetical protein BDN72DRAFT_122911 [Pluteus cervinus]|uniref:Uncharacterized protein n=1 Tax=Pluteus cervinus TaxID=181527 RepID=A0ACD3B892_9AGAR|nr:hypothetical protein BDN72DRAFT_122911 [Pluteus cervinus]